MHTVNLQGSKESFGVGKILCVGRNYAEHAREMKSDIPESPVIFMKPPTALVADGGNVMIPPISKELHHEVEMTVLIGTGGKDISQDRALSHVAGFGIGLDMTLRDVQAEAKKKSLPWTLSKAFDTSAPVSTFVPASMIKNPHDLNVELLVNGGLRQKSNTRHFIFQVDVLISYISRIFTLERGDILFTGTPEGVSQVLSGDKLQARLLSSDSTVLASLSVSVA